MQHRSGFVGLGIMGLSMTRNLLKAGHEVTVWNRSREKILDAVNDGALEAESPAALRAMCDTLFICVTNEAAVREVLFDNPDSFIHGAPGARIVVNMSTISPSAERAIAADLARQEVAYCDAPVTGGDVGARNGTLTIMAGGDETSFARLLPAFEAMGKNISHTGPVGSGQLCKCVNQILVALNIAAMSEAFAFLDRTPLDAGRTFDLLSSGAAGSWALSNYGPRVLKGDFKPGFRAVDMLKDIKIVLNEAEKMHLQLPATELMRHLFGALVATEKTGESLGNHALRKLYQ